MQKHSVKAVKKAVTRALKKEQSKGLDGAKMKKLVPKPANSCQNSNKNSNEKRNKLQK